MNKQIQHKPVIESLINTAAIALTAYGVASVTSGLFRGYVSILFGVGLEILKYHGRNKNLW